MFPFLFTATFPLAQAAELPVFELEAVPALLTDSLPLYAFPVTCVSLFTLTPVFEFE